MAELLHERPALGGVDDLGHVLPGDVHDLRVMVLLQECVHFPQEGALFVAEFKVHGLAPESG